MALQLAASKPKRTRYTRRIFSASYCLPSNSYIPDRELIAPRRKCRTSMPAAAAECSSSTPARRLSAGRNGSLLGRLMSLFSSSATSTCKSRISVCDIVTHLQAPLGLAHHLLPGLLVVHRPPAPPATLAVRTR